MKNINKIKRSNFRREGVCVKANRKSIIKNENNKINIRIENKNKKLGDSLCEKKGN